MMAVFSQTMTLTTPSPTSQTISRRVLIRLATSLVLLKRYWLLRPGVSRQARTIRMPHRNCELAANGREYILHCLPHFPSIQIHVIWRRP